jgi:hypothetical protein
VPIHDGTLNEAGKELTDTVMTALLGGDPYRRLNSGESLSITADPLGSWASDSPSPSISTLDR